MQDLCVRLTGITPLLIHCDQAANPFNKYSKALKHLTSRRKKTDQDYMEMARLEWESGLYLYDGSVQLPADNFEACFLAGAKMSKVGKQYKAGASLVDDHIPLTYKGPSISVQSSGEIPNPELDKYFDLYKHQQMVKVGAQKVLRTRPVFQEWKCEIALMYNEAMIDERTLFAAIENAGKYVGMCEKRPRLGRFEVEKI
jgi:hypothetical protein